MNEPVCFPRLTVQQRNWLTDVILKERNYYEEALNAGIPISNELQNLYKQHLYTAKDTLNALCAVEVYPASQPDIVFDSEDIKMIEAALHLCHAYFEKQISNGVTDAEYLSNRDRIPQIFWKLKKLKGE